MIPSHLSAIGAGVMRELGDHLWQSTIFAGVVALFALTLRKYQARTRYWLWLAASVKFLVPFSLLIAVGSHLTRPNPPTESRTSVYVAFDEMSQPFTMPNVPAISLPAQPTANSFPTFRLSDVLAVVWLCGFVVVLAYRCLQWRRIAKALRNAAPLEKGREIDVLRRIEGAAKLPRAIQPVSWPGSMEPGVFGFLHPVLLWP
jgi:bla regulator protein blaR1